MADNALPEDVTDRIDKLINETYQEHEPWDVLVTDLIALLNNNPKLVDLMRAMFDQIQLSWPTEGDLPAQLAQATENILAVAALHFIEPAAIVEQAMKSLSLSRIRGKAPLVKYLQKAETFSMQSADTSQQNKTQQAPMQSNNRSANMQSQNGTNTCSFCRQQMPSCASFCPDCACACKQNAYTCQRCHYTPKERTNYCAKCDHIRVDHYTATNEDQPCPTCKKPVDSNATFCYHCGAQMDTACCKKCLLALQDDARFCISCGFKVDQDGGTNVTQKAPAQLPKCPTCATVIVAGQPYCSSCACDVRHLSIPKGQAPGKTIQRVYDEARGCLVDPLQPI